MANELIIKNGFVSKGNSTIEGTFSGSTLKTNTIDTSLRNLYASDLTPTVDWEATQLVGVGGSVILDWTQGLIKDSGPNLSIDWNNRILYDGSEIGVLDWQNKIMTGMTNIETTNLTLSGTNITSSWTSYTPVWTSNGVTQPTIGNGSITGAYKLIGKTCFYRGKLGFGSTTAGGTGVWEISLPFAAVSGDGVQIPVSVLDNGNNWFMGLMNGAYGGFTTKSSILVPSILNIGLSQGMDATSPFTWGDTDNFLWNGSYEIA